MQSSSVQIISGVQPSAHAFFCILGVQNESLQLRIMSFTARSRRQAGQYTCPRQNADAAPVGLVAHSATRFIRFQACLGPYD
jgi:hypothetical protein